METLPVETPHIDELVRVIFGDNPSEWVPCLIYRQSYHSGYYHVDGGALVRSRYYSNTGTGPLPFQDVIAWCRWEGDPFENSATWFESKPKGRWSESKRGPAFKIVPFEETFVCPTDRSRCQVTAQPGAQSLTGTYRKDFECLCDKDGMPVFPFATWIEFTETDQASGKPKRKRRGPAYEEWKKEEHERKIASTKISNEAVKDKIVQELGSIRSSEPNLAVRLRKVKRLQDSLSSEFDMSLDPDGSGQHFMDQAAEEIEGELAILEQELVGMPARYPYTQRQLYKVVNQVEKGWSYETFTRSLSRNREVLGIPVEKDGRGNVSRKSYKEVQKAVKRKIEEESGWK